MVPARPIAAPGNTAWVAIETDGDPVSRRGPRAGSPIPRQLTFGFQSSNMPAGLFRHNQTWGTQVEQARLDLASCMTRTNRFADALSLAVEARTVASRLDSRLLADRADAIHRMARGRVAVDEPWRPLTAREFAVARLVSEGYTNAEIADSLGIASKTASSHVEHILAKLGASRRAEIATWASNVERSPLPH
jgi:DNA-binding CsgD family transcriptional regulator